MRFSGHDRWRDEFDHEMARMQRSLRTWIIACGVAEVVSCVAGLVVLVVLVG